MKITIISGRAGSGKSVCLHLLEDLDYYCIDNLPISLLPALIEKINTQDKRIAIGIDARNSLNELEQFTQVVEHIKKISTHCEIIFLDADDSVLLKRFSETRRKHPLSNNRISLKEALKRETQLLEPITQSADWRIDTSRLSVQQLRELVANRISNNSDKNLSLLFQSFGYKFGVPLDADYVFDVRCLPNPYWEPSLRSYTGRDQEVAEFLQQQPETKKMVDDIQHFVESWLPYFASSNRTYLTVAIGCTGGQHRSVYVAEQLVKYFEEKHNNVQIRHREF